MNKVTRMNDRNFPRLTAPFETDRIFVRPEWVDYNGHMNVTYYLKAFDDAFEDPYVAMGVDAASVARTGITTFTAEFHITYQREVKEGDRLRITTQLVDFDAKRMHFIQCMYHAAEGYLAATGEWLILCVDLNQRKVIPLPERLGGFLARTREAHRALPLPPEVGRRVSLTSGRPR
jgi:acyl-CoA thioester hydrolase